MLLSDRMRVLCARHGLAQAEFEADMAQRTTIRAGGSCACLLSTGDEAQLAAVLSLCTSEHIPFVVMGKGSNLLISDEGFDGVVIQLRNSAEQIVRNSAGNLIVPAGCSLPAVARYAAEQGLSGMEFASGIPGSVGGAVYMNAGAYGGEMAQILVSATVMDLQGSVRQMAADALDLGYRHSSLMDTGEIVLRAEIRLTPGRREEILAVMDELMRKRSEKQPLDYPSCGSFFKRPPNHFAAALIDQAGLKGLRIGAAQVSAKHAGFLINAGNARAADFYHLMLAVQDRVLAETGVQLEPEVQFVGRFV